MKKPPSWLVKSISSSLLLGFWTLILNYKIRYVTVIVSSTSTFLLTVTDSTYPSVTSVLLTYFHIFTQFSDHKGYLVSYIFHYSKVRILIKLTHTLIIKIIYTLNSQESQHIMFNTKTLIYGLGLKSNTPDTSFIDQVRGGELNIYRQKNDKKVYQKEDTYRHRHGFNGE